jgi:hypothetical protein
MFGTIFAGGGGGVFMFSSNDVAKSGLDNTPPKRASLTHATDKNISIIAGNTKTSNIPTCLPFGYIFIETAISQYFYKISYGIRQSQ